MAGLYCESVKHCNILDTLLLREVIIWQFASHFTLESYCFYCIVAVESQSILDWTLCRLCLLAVIPYKPCTPVGGRECENGLMINCALSQTHPDTPLIWWEMIIHDSAGTLCFHVSDARWMSSMLTGKILLWFIQMAWETGQVDSWLWRSYVRSVNSKTYGNFDIVCCMFACACVCAF